MALWENYVENGDASSFELLYKEYFLQLFRFSLRYVKFNAVAEEIVQDLFAELWENGRKLKVRTTIRSYLYGAIRNKSLNYLKHQDIRKKYDPEWMDQKEIPRIKFRDENREESVREAVLDAVDSLPARAKMTYKLHRNHGLTYDEIAEVMEVSVKTVEAQMSRSLKILREELVHLLCYPL